MLPEHFADLPQETIDEVMLRMKQWPTRKAIVEVEYVDTNGIKGITGVMVKNFVIKKQHNATNHEMLAVLGVISGGVSFVAAETSNKADNETDFMQACMLFQLTGDNIVSNGHRIVQVQSLPNGL